LSASRASASAPASVSSLRGLLLPQVFMLLLLGPPGLLPVPLAGQAIVQTHHKMKQSADWRDKGGAVVAYQRWGKPRASMHPPDQAARWHVHEPGSKKGHCRLREYLYHK
jgi:hypothetical protein